MDKIFSVKFKVLDNDRVEEVFDTFKAYQRLNLADRRSRIIFNEVKVPAGYTNTFEEFMGVYNGIVDGSFAEIIAAVPNDLDKEEIEDFLNVCNMERLNHTNEFLHEDKINSMVDTYMTTKEVYQKVKKSM